MKKILFTLVIAILTINGFAQTYTYGIKGGINLSRLNRLNSYGGAPEKTLTGFHAGGFVDIGYQNFSIQPGLFFSTKGNIERVIFDGAGPSSPIVYGTTKLNYLELPVNLLYKAQIGKAAKVFIGGGPYLGYALSGKWFADGHDLGKLTFGEGNYSRFDIGLNVTTGVEVCRKVIVGANYGLGLNYVSGGDTKQQNKVWSFSVGYLF